jgi:hypothetical protein
VLLKEIELQPGKRTDLFPTVGRSKADALRDAGVSTSARK